MSRAHTDALAAGESWVRVSVAARIAKLPTQTMKRTLFRFQRQTGKPIVRRWGTAGHWWVNVGLLADFLKSGPMTSPSKRPVAAFEFEELSLRVDALRRVLHSQSRRLRNLEKHAVFIPGRR